MRRRKSPKKQARMVAAREWPCRKSLDRSADFGDSAPILARIIISADCAESGKVYCTPLVNPAYFSDLQCHNFHLWSAYSTLASSHTTQKHLRGHILIAAGLLEKSTTPPRSETGRAENREEVREVPLGENSYRPKEAQSVKR